MAVNVLSTDYWIAIGVAVLLVITLVPWLAKHATSLGLIDVPNARSSHATTRPRGAGLALALGVSFGAAYLLYTGGLPERIAVMTLLSAVIVGGMGLLDDRFEIGVRPRLVVHLLAAATCVALVYGRNALAIDGAQVLYACLSALGLVWALNLFNFMDGIDGLALQQSIFIATGGAVLLTAEPSPWQGVLILVMATSASAMLWNWAPAKIFLGDVGSGFLGFLLGCASLDTVVQGNLSLASWMILWGVFVVDATTTLCVRILTRQRWYRPHRSHAYQKISRSLNSHASVSLGAVAINVLWLFPWAYAASISMINPLVCLAIAYIPLVVVVAWVRAGFPD